MAANYNQVSVKLGDTATYKVSVSGSTDNKSTILVWGIVGTVVYVNSTFYLPNGTIDYKSQEIINVYNGGLLTYMYLVAGNLSKNDAPYHGWTGYWINDTTSMIIAGINRTVNHLRTYGGLNEVWWDKDTGLMVKANIWFIDWFNFTMISSTAWSAPQQPASLLSNPMTLVAIGEGILIIVLIALIVLRGRGRKR
jgi:hypothetical protein